MNKFEELRKEEKDLVTRLGELQAEQKTVRATMLENPIEAAHSLATRFSQVQIQAEVFTEKLGIVRAQIQAEEVRLKDPSVIAGVKRAEKQLEESKAAVRRIHGELNAILADIAELEQKNAEASQLFNNGGRDGKEVVNGTAAIFLGYTKENLNRWKMGMGNDLIKLVK